jgi:drug/metabolite transporter (DMT)-like permease
VTAFLLFGVWSNTFIAISFLLGRDGADPRFDWLGITVARFLFAAVPCAAYCLLFRRTESLEILRRHTGRLLLCSLLSVPGYNMALCYGQQHGVPAPIASLTTTLVPLFVMTLAALFLRERLTARRVAGFAVAAAGMVVISFAKKTTVGEDYPLLIGITALAPLCWSIYSVVSKPMAGRVSPIVWTYMATSVGSLLMLPLLPGRAWSQWSDLDAAGWAALAYLALPSTVLGFALWTWLLRFLPASTVGFTVFLNPPLTTLSKFLFATLLPSTFLFTIQPREWLGGAITLAGMAIAVYSRAVPAGGPPLASGTDRRGCRAGPRSGPDGGAGPATE